MPTITLRFSYEINTSTQIGDILYFTPATIVGSTNFKEGGAIYEIGPIYSITRGGTSYTHTVANITPGSGGTFTTPLNPNIIGGMNVVHNVAAPIIPANTQVSNISANGENFTLTQPAIASGANVILRFLYL